MISGLVLIMFGCIVAMFDFKGILLNEDNYAIVNEVERVAVTKVEEPTPVASPKQGNEDTWGLDNSTTNQQPDLTASTPNGQPKQYSTLQGGQEFAGKSPKDFVKFK